MNPVSLREISAKYLDPYISGKIALAKVTTNSEGTTLNFSTAFRNKGGVIDLGSVILVQLKISVAGSTDSILYSVDGIEDSEGDLIYQTLPGGQAFVFRGFDTNIDMAFKDGSGTGTDIELEALYITG